MIAFLHTSAVHISRFSQLAANLKLDLKVEHYVNEDLLKTALENGEVDESALKEQIELIRSAGAEKIICTCSTLGSASEKLGVMRIDRPVVEYMVAKYSKIGMVYSTTSTKLISKKLIEDCALALGKKVEVALIDCTAFWGEFEKGNKNSYYEGIRDKVSNQIHSVDVIFLAQASMENVRDLLTEVPIEVLTSPEIGVNQLLGNIR